MQHPSLSGFEDSFTSFVSLPSFPFSLFQHVLSFTRTDQHSSTRSQLILESQHTMQLPVSKHRWITSACLLDMSHDLPTALVCGDKDGSIHCYQYSASRLTVAQDAGQENKAIEVWNYAVDINLSYGLSITSTDSTPQFSLNVAVNTVLKVPT